MYGEHIVGGLAVYQVVEAELCHFSSTYINAVGSEPSRELVGSVLLHKDQVDGIILLSAFPCGLDSMANELLMRKIKQVPILNLMLDAQRGMAGVETRLESFVDIIRFKEGMAV